MSPDNTERIAAAEAKIDSLEGWQVRQNGSIHRIEGKIDKMSGGIALALLGLIANLLVTIFT